MKLCIVSTAFPRWKGDYRGLFVLEAAKALQANGVEVLVVASHYPGAKSKESLESVQVYRPRYLWPESFEILQKESEGLPMMWRERRITRLIILPYLLTMGIAIAKYARKCDLIHANWTLSATMAQLTRFFHQRPILVTVHGSDIFQAARLPLFKNATRYFLNRCEKVIAVSKSLAQETITLGVQVTKIETIPDGVDVNYFTPPDGSREPIILFVGSLIVRKGLRYLLEAMPAVFKRYPDYSLVIAGEGPQLADLEDLARSLDVIDRIRFLGAQTPEAVRGWMQRARLFVLPSVEEGLGVVLLEALSSGTPCVTTNVGGIPDLITPDVGILVPASDSLSLSEAIVTLLGNSDKWEQMSNSARKRAQREFSWEMISKRLIEQYELILSR